MNGALIREADYCQDYTFICSHKECYSSVVRTHQHTMWIVFKYFVEIFDVIFYHWINVSIVWKLLLYENYLFLFSLMNFTIVKYTPLAAYICNLWSNLISFSAFEDVLLTIEVKIILSLYIAKTIHFRYHLYVWYCEILFISIDRISFITSVISLQILISISNFLI